MWQVYRAVRLAMLLDTPLAYGSTFGREIAFTDDLWKERLEGSTSWLALEGDLPVGAATLFRFPEQDLDEGCLVAMWVAPHARGAGAGDALVTTLVGHATSAGLRRVTLDVADGNHRAAAFYRRLGFTRTGRTGTLPQDPQVTEFEMERLLDGHPASAP
jgi:ribosomal protein S18 acetylase RimI-like enzyme